MLQSCTFDIGATSHDDDDDDGDDDDGDDDNGDYDDDYEDENDEDDHLVSRTLSCSAFANQNWLFVSRAS